MIDISYRIFDLVASTNSLTKTAEIVHLTPSAVSHSLRKLEERLGMQLVVRNRDGLRLTQYGQELIPHVRYALKAEERLQQEIVRICDIRTGILNVGVFSSVGCNWMPDIMLRMQKEYPQIKMYIHQGSYTGLEAAVANGELDAAFVSVPITGSIPAYPLLHDRLMCITPKSFEAENGDYITLEDLRKNTLILPHAESDFDARAFLESDFDARAFLSANNIEMENPHQLADDALIIAMVESGQGISIMPELVLDYLGGNIRVFPIEGAPFRTIGIATQRSEYVTPVTKIFVRTVQDYVAQRYPEELPYFR